MDIYEKARKLVERLTIGTNSNEIEWEISEIPESFTNGTEYKFPFCYTTTFKEQKIGIFEKRFKHFTDIDEYFWTAEIGLYFLNENNKVMWEYVEQSKEFLDLYESVKEQSSNIENVLSDLIS